MVQTKVDKELANLGDNLTITDGNEGYITHIKSKINSTRQDTEVNHVLTPQGPTNNYIEEVLAGEDSSLSVLSPPTYSSNSQNLNQSHMKCYYDCTHCCFLDYFNDPIPDDAVIYVGDKPFQYKIEGRYTEFIGNPIGTVFVAVKRDHEFLICKGRNKPNMSSDSINFGQHNTNKNCNFA